jgi:hypothetical protein
MCQSLNVRPAKFLLHRSNAFDGLFNEDDIDHASVFPGTPSIRRIPLNTAPEDMRRRQWRSGVYVIFDGPNRVYVGSSSNLPQRLGYHLWYATRIYRRIANHLSVKVFHFPGANLRTLRAHEHRYKTRFPIRFEQQTHTADDEFAVMDFQPGRINRLERGIHGYFPFPRGMDNRLEEGIDAALPSRVPLRPGTRCTEAQHRYFYGRVNRECKTSGRGFSCINADTVDQLFAKSARAQACATARQAYQRRCFDRSHSDWQRHEQARNQAERASRRCWELGRERLARSRRQGDPFDAFLSYL